MKINATISKPSLRLENADNKAIMSAVIIALGVITGVIVYYYSDTDILESLYEYFISYTTDFSHKNKPEIISGLLLINLPYLFIMIFLGTSIIGGPLSLLISAIKSMGLGILTTYIYDSFSLKGIEYCLLIFFPGKFFLIFAMLMLTKNSWVTSSEIRKKVQSNHETEISFDKYILRSFIISIIVIISAVVDFLTMTCFSSLFDFTS